MQEFLTNYHLPSLLKASWQAAVLILLVLAVQWALGRRLSPRWRYGLWLLVVARLAVPWTLPSSVSLFNLLSFSHASAAVASLRANSGGPGTPAPPDTAVPATSPEETAADMPVAPAPELGVSLSLWLLVWAAGALALAVCLVILHYRLARRVTSCRPLIDAPVMNLLEDCKQAMGLRVPVTLVETAAVGSPSVFGFVRPRLLLPIGLTRSFSQEELRYVFLHELSHLKRQDILTGWLMTGLQILHWFNPLVWLAFYRMRVDRELACDALALSYAREEENQPYGRTIIKLLEGFGCSAWAPSLAGTVETKTQLKERISMIAKFRRTNRVSALAGALFVGLGLVTLTDAQTQMVQQASKALQAEAGNQWNLQQKLKMAEAGNKWAAYDLWDAYYRGNHGIQPDPDQADKWLRVFVQGAWVVRFEPVDDFAPKTPAEFLGRVNHYASTYSGRKDLGLGSFFRTTEQGGKLVGSFLTGNPVELKARLAKVPGVQVTSSEPITAETFIRYEQSRQESLVNIDEPDASKGVWVVRFEPVGDFSPRTPAEFLARIHVYSGQEGEIGYFRTQKRGEKLVGSFLAYDADQLKAALGKVPELKVISVEKLTQQQLTEYEQSPQESL
jgi:beta-lactamase regulating signal transducer with metallopeptidase domain